jgi:putative salt-induced outer membrane protein
MANINALSTKKWDKNEWMFGGDANYGETEGTKTAESIRGYTQFNRLFTDRAFGYLRLEGLRDEIADVDYRFTFSPGLGYYFIKNERTFLRAEAGPGYVVEKQGGVTDDYITLRIAERFEHKFNDKAKLWQSLEFLPQVDDWENFIVNAELGVETVLTESLSLRTYLQDTYDNEPAPGRKENDLKLFAGIAYKF